MKIPTPAQSSAAIKQIRAHAEFSDSIGSRDGRDALAYLDQLAAENEGMGDMTVVIAVIQALAAHKRHEDRLSARPTSELEN